MKKKSPHRQKPIKRKLLKTSKQKKTVSRKAVMQQGPRPTTDVYPIESGIKIPPITKSKPTVTISPAVATMNALDKGQSFLVKDPTAAFQAAKLMRDLMSRERDRDGDRNFISRKVGDGLRIWRTS